MKTVTIVLPCYNEVENIDELYARLVQESAKLPQYSFSYLFIDNDSQDGTRSKIRALCQRDPSVKAIFNVRNFGHIRSPYHAILQSTSDAVILMASDLQDPPELMAGLIKQWEAGFKIVSAVKTKSEENWLMFQVRRTYYRILQAMSDVPQIQNFTGFGLYDKVVVTELRRLNEPYPFLRGLVAELGFKVGKVEFRQPQRKRGFTKNNFFTLYDIGVLGIISYSKVPLRLATFVGFTTAALSVLVGVVYLLYKLVFWDQFQVGTAPMVIGLFFISSVQLFFLGLLGEYVGVIFTQTKSRPHVVEEERINL